MSQEPVLPPTQNELDQRETGGGGVNVVHPGSEHGSHPRMIDADQSPTSRFDPGPGPR